MFVFYKYNVNVQKFFCLLQQRNSKIAFFVYKTIVISYCCVVYVLCLNISKGLKQSARAEGEFTKYQTMTSI